MTDITWPSGLPQKPLVDGYQETLPNQTLRTEMDAGPAKTRRRTTAAVRSINAAYILTATELASLETFYLQTLSGGALSFLWPRPRGTGTWRCRFKKPPAIAAMNGRAFRAVLELEHLP